MSGAPTIQAAAEFLWREADLLDRFCYDDWLDLWTPDGLYIVPIEDDVEDYADVLNYAYDNDQMRRMRIARLGSPHSMSATAGARTVRTISRFVAVDAGRRPCTCAQRNT